MSYSLLTFWLPVNSSHTENSKREGGRQGGRQVDRERKSSGEGGRVGCLGRKKDTTSVVAVVAGVSDAGCTSDTAPWHCAWKSSQKKKKDSRAVSLLSKWETQME